ncbi:MAG: hypothetical protein QM820_45160 [Minicystis sp.]
MSLTLPTLLVVPAMYVVWWTFHLRRPVAVDGPAAEAIEVR